MRATVATLVDPGERLRVDAATGGRFAAIHKHTVWEVIRAVRERPVQAVLLSPAFVQDEQLYGVATLVERFPGVPTVAVVSRHDATASARLLELGALGIRQVFDLGAREGWESLRELLSHPAQPIGAAILGRLIPALGEASEGSRRFFEVLVRVAPSVSRVRTLSRRVGIPPSTFISRFFRARVPSPKRYLAATRLVHAAGLFEAEGLSIADVAYRLEYSSPQSFGRHLRSVLGLTAGEFRRRYTFAHALDEFVSRLIVPFRSNFHTFHPFERGG